MSISQQDVQKVALLARLQLGSNEVSAMTEQLDRIVGYVELLSEVDTEGVEPKKTNWALKLDKPPYLSWPVTGGITFTFGGLKVTGDAQVVATDWKPIPGLYTCGEMVGGLFHYNYPLGTGLMSGAVFGRIAGRAAAHA